MTRLTIDAVIPGGIRRTDHVHHITNDGTCSRCRKVPVEEEVPLMLWFTADTDMLIYCESCISDDAWAAMAPIVPA